MTRSPLRLSLMAALLACSLRPALDAAITAPDLDIASHVRRADLVYDRPPDRSDGGMPLGNGTMGTLVWTSPHALHMQINRVDVFAIDRSTNSFNRNEDYCSGCGLVDIELAGYGRPLFIRPHHRQRIDVYDGAMTVQGRDVSVKLVAHPALDVIALQIDDRRDQPQPVRIDLRMLRYAETFHLGRNFALSRSHASLIRTRNHLALSSLDIRDGRTLLTQHFTEGHYQCSSAVAIAIVGRPAQARFTNGSTVTLTAAPQAGPVTVLIASAAGFTAPPPVMDRALRTLDQAAARTFAQLAGDSAAWWHDFWPRCFVRLSSPDGRAEVVEKHFTWWLYLMGSASRGPMPMKYNGMLWNSHGDLRMWGSQQWWHNLSMYYRALHAANHPQLLAPLFNMYFKMYDSAALAARQQWGSRGIFIGETSFFNGWQPLPEDIAAEMRDLYLFRKPWSQASRRFLDFAATKHPQSSRWNWKGVGRFVNGRWQYPTKTAPPNGHVVHLFGSMAQLAHQYYVAWQHTGDRDFLARQAYPMLKGVAEFFCHFPNLRRGDDGKLHFHHTNCMEGIRDTTDSISCLSAMRAILPQAIAAAATLNRDADLRRHWQATLADLAELPHSGMPDALVPSKPGEPVFWVPGRQPTVIGQGGPSLYPVAFLDLCCLETAETDPPFFQRAVNTYRRRWPNGVPDDVEVNVLGLNALVAARLGRADDAATLIYNQITRPRNNYCDWEGSGPPLILPNRMTLREGPGAMEAQRLGNAAYGLTEALLQSLPGRPDGPPVLRLFAAWPKTWNARFKLHARGGFIVTAACTNGRIHDVQITSERGETCRLRNPWPGRPVQLIPDGQPAQRLDGNLLTFPTRPASRYELLPTLGEK